MLIPLARSGGKPGQVIAAGDFVERARRARPAGFQHRSRPCRADRIENSPRWLRSTTRG